jgi:tetratricopeptide (TPR) repeat protein
MKQTIFIFLSVFFVLPPVVLAGHGEETVVRSEALTAPDSTPPHAISYRNETAPDWKKIWDHARNLYTRKKYEQAQVQYEVLLSRKDNIDQARWEYVSVLMNRQLWQKAHVELSILLGHDPDRAEYRLAAAEIAVGCRDFNTAVSLYAALYEKQCTAAAPNMDRARVLSGYIASLEGLHRIETVLPLMEQLVKLQPEDAGLHRRLAQMAMERKQPQRALHILAALRENNALGVAGQQIMARTYEALDKPVAAATCWQQVVGQDPGNRVANQQLITYYRSVGNRPMELKHIRALLADMPDNTVLLNRAAALNIALNRPDRALEYYNLLLAMNPGNLSVVRLKDEALHAVAAQLLGLVANSGSSLLWQDLVQVTADRVGIYRALADILRSQKRWGELYEVLLVIRREVPADKGIRDELNILIRQQDKSNTVFASARQREHTAPVIISR